MNWGLPNITLNRNLNRIMCAHKMKNFELNVLKYF